MLLVGGGDSVVSMKWFAWMQQWHVTYADATSCIFNGTTGQLLRRVKDSMSFPTPSLPSILASSPAGKIKCSSGGGSSSKIGIYVQNGFTVLVCADMAVWREMWHIF
jgi:hypothetical protein